MRYRVVFMSLLKAMLFAASLLVISITMKLSYSYSCKSIPSHEAQSAGDTTFYFIGTSRMQRSVSPEILKAELPNYNFFNLGLSNNSFLYSCKAASNLLRQGSAKKIIFIELTGLALAPSGSYYFLLTHKDVWEVIKQHLSIQCTREDMSALLFYLFSIQSDIKKIIYPRLNLYSQPEVGFSRVGGSGYTGSMHEMLTPKSFEIKTRISPDLLDAYIEIINDLKTEAEERGSEIIFILPLNISKAKEFHIDMSVFSQLSENSKWSYSDEFLNTMNNPKFLYDSSHLNFEGSRRYSDELSKFIRTRLITRSKE